MYTKEERTRLIQIGGKQIALFNEIRFCVDATQKDHFTYKELAERILPLAEQILKLESQAEVIEFLRQMRDKEQNNEQH